MPEYRVTARLTRQLETTVEAANQADAEILGLLECQRHGTTVEMQATAEEVAPLPVEPPEFGERFPSPYVATRCQLTPGCRKHIGHLAACEPAGL